MSLARHLYTGILFALTPAALLRLAWRARRQPEYLRHVGERFGIYRPVVPRPPIWVHAVSVGETHAAEPLIRALRKNYADHPILLTHMTPTGRKTGEQLFGGDAIRCYLPYDLPPAVARFLRHFRPAFGVLMETELWPNLIHACRARNIPLFLVNARLSERSARGYRRFGRLTADALRALAAVGAQSEADAARLQALGARAPRITGNLKFDRGPRPEDLALGAQLRERFGARPVLLAASTREGEEELVLDATADAPAALLLVMVPRHPQRFDEVAGLLQRRGLRYQRRSEAGPVPADTRVVLGDSMGEMFAYYAACDIAFVGGSLVPRGGQNLLEACAVGVPVLIGPHTFNFADATALALSAGAAARVDTVASLAREVQALLGDSARRARMGKAGKELMHLHQGATLRTLALFPTEIEGDG
jgi:3-deoxy-D-manno-octulosonic-acid transferase